MGKPGMKSPFSRLPQRRSQLRRSGIKKSNPKRRKSEFARCYHSTERVLFVQGLPCVSCGNLPSQNAHIENGGAGRKASYTKIVPMCAYAHGEFHNSGRKFCEENWQVNLDDEAAKCEARWQNYLLETKKK